MTITTERRVRPLWISALDLSLTSTAIARSRSGAHELTRVQPRTRGHERLEEIRTQVRIGCTGADLVVIESGFMGGSGSTTRDLAGLDLLIRHTLWTMHVRYVLVTPATRAKWLTDKGNATKDECLAAAIKRFGHLVDIRGNDEADAFTLDAMAHEAYDQPLVTMPADRRALLFKTSTSKGKRGLPVIAWPQIERTYEGE